MKLRLMIGLTLAAWAAPAAFASGYGQSENGVMGLGSIGAFVARAEDGSALFYNPAGLAQLERGELALSGKALFSRSFYSNVGQSTWESDDQIEGFPVFFWNAKLGRFAFGLGAVTPFYYEIAWDEADFPGRFRANGSAIQVDEYLAGIAFKMTEHLSFGATFRYAQADYRLTNIETRPFSASEPSLFYETEQKFEMDDQSNGFTAGFQYRRGRRLAIGLAYQSAIDLELEGDRVFRQITRADDIRAADAFARDFAAAPAASELTLADRIQAGFATRITVRTRLEVDLALARWSEVEQTLFNTRDAAGAAEQVVIPRQWDDSLEVRISGDFQQRRNLLWRMGLASVEGVAPDATVEPGFPDDDRFMYSFGVSYTLRKRYVVEAGWSYVQNRDTRTRDQEFLFDPNRPPSYLVANGQEGLFETQRTLLSIGLRVRFGRFSDD